MSKRPQRVGQVYLNKNIKIKGEKLIKMVKMYSLGFKDLV